MQRLEKRLKTAAEQASQRRAVDLDITHARGPLDGADRWSAQEAHLHSSDGSCLHHALSLGTGRGAEIGGITESQQTPGM